jgi:hypothetical protein
LATHGELKLKNNFQLAIISKAIPSLPFAASQLLAKENALRKYLTRAEAAAYLTERGLPISKNTLGKMATVGGGPPYQLFGNKAVSTPAQLDEWVEAKLSPPKRSTGEAP